MASAASIQNAFIVDKLFRGCFPPMYSDEFLKPSSCVKINKDVSICHNTREKIGLVILHVGANSVVDPSEYVFRPVL